MLSEVEKQSLVPLTNAVTFQRGFDLPTQNRRPGPYPVITSSKDSNSYHAEAKVPGPGVVIGRSGAIGGGQYIESDFWPLNTTLWVKDFKGNNKKYIYYLLKSIDFSVFNAGSGVPTLNRNHLSALKVYLPDIHTQDKITDILGKLDEKIQLNGRINDTLDKICQSIFKADIINHPNFERWQKNKIGDCCQVLLGGTPSRAKPEYWNNGTVGWINSGKVNEFRIINPSELITNDALKNSATKILSPGTTVIAITGATLGQVSRLEGAFATNQSVIGIIGNGKISNEFVYFWITFNIHKIIGSRTGGAQQHINRGNVTDFEIIIPSDEVLLSFQQRVKPLMDKIAAKCFEIQTLESLRDTLLPRLTSGKLQV